MIRMINHRDDLVKLKSELGVRADWHEPDEMEVDAKVFGASFDNAGFWGPNVNPYLSYAEQHVVLYREGEPVAAVNLATLFAWATGFQAEEVKRVELNSELWDETTGVPPRGWDKALANALDQLEGDKQ